MTRAFLEPKLILAAWLGLLVAASACAGSGTCETRREPRTGALGENSWRRLEAVNQKITDGRLGEARTELLDLLGRAGSDGYLQAILNQALGQVEWASGNDAAALGYLEAAVARDALPDAQHYTVMYQVAQLYFAAERYPEALERLQRWFCATPPDQVTADAWVLKAAIHARLGDFPGVLAAIESAMALEEQPPESWYRMKLAAQYELEQYRLAADTLEALISRWPDNPQYWLQLSQVLLRLQEEDRALAVLALAYRKGLLNTEGDIVFLAGLYRQAKVPYKAAEVLERGIREGIVQADEVNWTAIADAWYAAAERERSLRAWTEAGRLADDGLTDLRRAYILVDLERWEEALEALNLALRKGGLDERQVGEAQLLRGIARFRQGHLEQAGADWEVAGRYAASRASARAWLDYLQEERAWEASGGRSGR